MTNAELIAKIKAEIERLKSSPVISTNSDLKTQSDMKTPDKIYIAEHNANVQTGYFSRNRDDVFTQEYIRKDIVDDMLKTAEDHAYFAGSVNEREKMMEEAVEGEVVLNPFPTICLDDCKNYDFNDGDKVRVIVCKKEDL